MREIPHLSADLLRTLCEEFPHRCPLRGENPEDIQRYAGKRELIDALMFHAYGSDTEAWPFR